MTWQPDTASDYIEAVDGVGASAAGSVMGRLGERLMAAPSADAKLSERKAAAEAVVEIASNSERPEAVINHAKAEAGSVAQKTSTKKAIIVEPIEEKSRKLRRDVAKAGISLDHGYGLDEYLENNLVQVKKWQSTDHHADPRFEWEFDDDTVVETKSGTAYSWYEFWVKLAEATEKQLLPEFASEQIGDPDNDPQYAELSLGPESRPWSASKYIQCITDLENERSKNIETVGPRPEVWESVRNHIARSRAVTDLTQAVEHKALHVTYDEDGDLAEVWVPTAVINSQAEEHSVEPHGLHSEVIARGADSDELGGERIAEPQRVGTTTLRFWRLDATHPEVPEPDEIVEELTTSTDSLDSMEWGDVDE